MRTFRIAALLLAFAAAAVAPAAGETAVGTVTFAESWPQHTELDLPDIPDAPDIWRDAMAGARGRIDLAGFYFSRKGDGKDAQGPDSAPDLLLPVLDGIAAAAGRGVAVRLTADAKFAQNYGQVPAWAADLPGAQTRIFDVGARWGGVLHAKYFLVDDDLLYVGSQNFDWRALGQIHELGVLVRQPELAAQLRRIYDLDWELAGAPDAMTGLPAPASPSPIERWEGVPVVTAAGDTLQATLAASPREGLPLGVAWDLPMMVQMIDAARDSVHVQLLSYHVTDRQKRLFDDLDGALRRAAVRGAQVRLLVSNWALSRHGLPWLQSLAAVPGLEVRFTTIPEHPDGFIPYARVEHAKYLTVDGHLLWVGTSNWSRDYFHGSRNISLFFRGAGATRDPDRFFNLSWHGPYAETLEPCGEYAPPRRN
jgi:phosphatidylserine/phosphatidylglycerophosphate/cardiolipin synthase-like enzyme